MPWIFEPTSNIHLFEVAVLYNEYPFFKFRVFLFLVTSRSTDLNLLLEFDASCYFNYGRSKSSLFISQYCSLSKCLMRLLKLLPKNHLPVLVKQLLH